VQHVRAAAAGSLAVAATGWNFSNLGPAADVLCHAYGTGLGTIGVLVSALVLVHTAMNIPSGRLADTFGAPRVAIGGCLIMAVCNGVASITPDLRLAFAMRLLGGVGTAASFVGAAAYVRVVTRSPLAQGIVGGFALGGAGLALAVIPLLEGLDWRAPFLSSVVVSLVAVAAFAVAPVRGMTPARSSSPATSLRSLVGDGRLYRVGVIHICSMGTSMVVGAWVVTLLTREAGYSTKQAGLVGSLLLLVGVAARPAGGWLHHRHPHLLRPSLQASLVTGGVGTISLATSPPLPLAVLACLAVGIAAGVPFAPAFAAAAALRPDAPGAAVGLVNMLANLFILAVTPVVGALFGVGGGAVALGCVGAVWALASLAVPGEALLATNRSE
jgi:MFS family permease